MKEANGEEWIGHLVEVVWTKGCGMAKMAWPAFVGGTVKGGRDGRGVGWWREFHAPLPWGYIIFAILAPTSLSEKRKFLASRRNKRKEKKREEGKIRK